MSGSPHSAVQPSIAVVGAGLAGLALAQALVKAGIDVQVYERDAADAPRRQGYRLTLDQHGLAALRSCLPPHLFDLLVATKGAPGGFFRFTDKNLRDIFKLSFPADPDSGGQVDRQTLHTILRIGLGDRIHFGKAAVGVDDEPGGAVVRFADATSAAAPIVVAADGVGSTLRAQLAPGAEPAVSESWGI